VAIPSPLWGEGPGEGSIDEGFLAMANAHKQETDAGEKLKSWIIVLLICVFILTYGAIVFWTVGDRGPADWDFGALPDVPGQSAFSMEKGK